MEILKLLFYILIFPGFLFSTVFGLFLSGIDRKVVAKMQRRVGPPILQPFYDLFKLIGKERIIPREAARKVFIMAPIIGLVAAVTISLFIPIFGFTFVPNAADIIVIIYLLTIPAVALMIGGSSSGSPYAGVGISREMVAMLSYELPLVIVLLAVGLKVGHGLDVTGGVTFSLAKINDYQVQNGTMISHLSMIPAAIAFLLLIPAEVGSVPFDVAEAETEICEGPLVEYSGLYLGIYKLTSSVKIVIMTSLFVVLFLGGRGFGNLFANIILFIVLCIVITIISISFIKGVVGRIKIEQTLKFFWIVPTTLGILSLVLAYLGL
ncbi:respiratory chain complex I subunit 1 family protein [Haloimpatiens sp. FM7330]|uniref:respiratory chain complex I subunit 1 family protein n=1 Tax=Haloimpatiens sp. FM7330 TaxID=3298610 RepID=UPI00362C6C3A